MYGKPSHYDRPSLTADPWPAVDFFSPPYGVDPKVVPRGVLVRPESDFKSTVTPTNVRRVVPHTGQELFAIHLLSEEVGEELVLAHVVLFQRS
jgi:hypothetical protein